MVAAEVVCNKLEEKASTEFSALFQQQGMPFQSSHLKQEMNGKLLVKENSVWRDDSRLVDWVAADKDDVLDSTAVCKD